MKSAISTLCLFASASLYAGGSSGGVSGLHNELALSIADAAFNIDALPKIHLDADTYRRTEARLSVQNSVSSVPVVTLDGDTIEVRKFRDSMVDVKLSKEILPATTYQNP